MGKHRPWHIWAAMTSTEGELSREYIPPPDQVWEFIGGFDTKKDAEACASKIIQSITENLIYGGDDYDLEVIQDPSKKKKGKGKKK